MRLIDADMLLKEIENNYSQAWAGRDFADIVQQQPTINAKPVKHGRWDTYDVVKILASGRTLDGFCQCEACGSIFPINFSEYSFCPECGARMDGDKT